MWSLSPHNSIRKTDKMSSASIEIRGLYDHIASGGDDGLRGVARWIRSKTPSRAPLLPLPEVVMIAFSLSLALLIAILAMIPLALSE
jgi:hypothetical protein